MHTNLTIFTVLFNVFVVFKIPFAWRKGVVIIKISQIFTLKYEVFDRNVLTNE